jgi:hypothetical protein
MPNAKPTQSTPAQKNPLPTQQERIDFEISVDFEADLEQDLALLEQRFVSYITVESTKKSLTRSGQAKK